MGRKEKKKKSGRHYAIGFLVFSPPPSIFSLPTHLLPNSSVVHTDTSSRRPLAPLTVIWAADRQTDRGRHSWDTTTGVPSKPHPPSDASALLGEFQLWRFSSLFWLCRVMSPAVFARRGDVTDHRLNRPDRAQRPSSFSANAVVRRLLVACVRVVSCRSRVPRVYFLRRVGAMYVPQAPPGGREVRQRVCINPFILGSSSVPL
ncbi:hypothetical protein B0T19DRAFT_240298 [Cercophora scortea]|uniref:Uncharacterized protein n=1 Tax=Cercophora scortea TaxID=314031 RepID=A0AAE0M760_9PEZI|nr:hypothetical protein B0T19DRAFT_240298 [Cercophora scortea]